MIGLLLAASLVFHPIQIVQLDRESCGHWTKARTHLEIEGYVTYTAPEDDGDQHIRVCDDPHVVGPDPTRCMVWEIIPAIPLSHPKVGDHVRGQGILRYDAESPGHHWFELHPLLHIETLP